MELPFSVWCGGCGVRVAQGTRFNARKQKLAAYLNQIESVSLEVKCPACSHPIVLHTDPQKGDYLVHAGGRREASEASPPPPDKPDKERMVDNPFFRLEHETRTQLQAKRTTPTLLQLQARSDRLRNDFAVGHALRRRHRLQKEADGRDPEQALRARLDAHQVELLPERPEDVRLAKALFPPRRNK